MQRNRHNTINICNIQKPFVSESQKLCKPFNILPFIAVFYLKYDMCQIIRITTESSSGCKLSFRLTVVTVSIILGDYLLTASYTVGRFYKRKLFNTFFAYQMPLFLLLSLHIPGIFSGIRIRLSHQLFYLKYQSSFESATSSVILSLSPVYLAISFVFCTIL